VKHPLRRTAWSAAVLAIAALAVPGAASATNTIDCTGKTAKSADAPDTLDYSFRCSEEISGYTIVTNRLLAAFEPEVLVTTGTTDQPAQGESFGCEGGIPGFGTGCIGKASAWNWAHSEVHTDAPVCSKKEGPLLVRLVVADYVGRISQPFVLRSPKCPKAKPKPSAKKHKRPAQRHSARRHN
jgi:hypothetical protein